MPTQLSSVRKLEDGINFQWVISDYKKLQDQGATVGGPMILSSHGHPYIISLSFSNSSMKVYVRRYYMPSRMRIFNFFFVIPKESIFVKVPTINIDDYAFTTELLSKEYSQAQATPICTADENLTIGIKGVITYPLFCQQAGCDEYFGASCQKRLEMIFKHGTFSDLCVKDCEGVETFRVHRAVLASASDILRQLLKENKSNAIIELKDASRDNIADILTYIYSGTSPSNHNNAKDILITAGRFRLEDLANECVFELLKSVNPTNVVDYLSLASELSVYGELLESPCISLIKQSYCYVCRTESWKALRESSTHLAMDIIKKVHNGEVMQSITLTTYS